MATNELGDFLAVYAVSDGAEERYSCVEHLHVVVDSLLATNSGMSVFVWPLIGERTCWAHVMNQPSEYPVRKEQ